MSGSDYRGVPHNPQSRRERMRQLEREMRERNLSHGSGCKAKARAIAERLGKQ